MRARYYSPELRRFVNADIIPGEISQAVTLNRYAYANGNPVSNVDPFGLEAWSNWAKFGVGLACIAVAVAAVVIAPVGTIAATMATAALTGSVLSGAVGAATGYLSGGLDGAATGFMTGTFSGLVSGAATASTLSVGKLALVDIGVEVVTDWMEEESNDEEYTLEDVALSVKDGLIQVAAGYSIDILKNDPIEPGWFHKNGSLYPERQKKNRTIAKQNQRSSREATAAAKNKLIAKQAYKDAVNDQLFKYGKDVIDDSIREFIIDPNKESNKATRK